MMKKFLGIVVLGFLLCGKVYAAETKKTIEDKYKSKLPDCDNGIIAEIGNSKKWTAWNNCFGRVRIDIAEEGSFVIAEDFSEDGTGVSLWIMGSDHNKFPGAIFYKTLTKSGCKKNGHGIFPNGNLYKVKWNKTCDNIIKVSQIK